MEITILYEDNDILALDKPSGLIVHSDGRTEEPSLVDWLNENYPELSNVGEEERLQSGEVIKRPGIVHRLDRDTSGVILIAKNKESFQFLKEQFQGRNVEKIYHAVVWGNFSDEKMEGVIDKPIGRSTQDFRRWSAEFGAKGELREAITEYKVIAQGGGEGEKVSYLEIRPKTGRTHQIRVHLKSISHPVVCDNLYASGKPAILGFNRLALHAFSIKLQLPDQSFIQIESPLPFEFENALNVLKKG